MIVALYKTLKDEDGLADRQSGRLPLIVIDSTPYYIEIRFDWLTPVDAFMLPEINLTDCSRLTYDGRHQLFFYDNKNKAAVTDLSTAAPENLLLVKIPENRFLDPYRHSETVNLPITGFLEDGKMLMYREAETVPVTRRMLDRAAHKLGPRASFEELFNDAKKTALKNAPSLKKPAGIKINKGKNKLS